MDRSIEQQPRPGGARLAGVQEDPDRDGVHRLLEVRVREDDDRRLAAGLQRDALEGLRPELHQPPADLAAAGEADLVDARVARERLADHVDRADDAVGDARRQRSIRSSSSKIAIDDAGVSLAGLSTNVQPVAIAAPILRSGRSTGSFHGVMSPHTPTGSFRTKFRRWPGPSRHLAADHPRGGGVELDPVDGGLDLALPHVADRLAHLDARRAARAVRPPPAAGRRAP